MSRCHEWKSERLLMLLSDSRYRRDMARLIPVIPVGMVVARMTCTEECAHSQEAGKDRIQQPY